MRRDEIKELSALYAIGALDPATASEVEQYLRTAPADEQREVEELKEVAALLPLALPRAPVPAHLKERLLARLNQAEAEAPASPSSAAPTAKVVPFTPPARTESRSARWLLVAATVTLATLSGLLLWQNSRLTRERNDLARQVELKSQELAHLISPETRVLTLMGEAAPQASAKLVYDTPRQEWMMYISDLPAAPADKDYQLWYITTEQAKISAQLFRPDAQGRSELHLSLPLGVASHLAATAVTLEPKGGSRQPTGQIFLKGTI